MTLDKLKDGEKAVITKVNGAGNLRCRLLDMGLIPKTTVTIVKRAPMGDPLEIRLRGYELTIRKDEAKNIEVNKFVEAKSEPTNELSDKEKTEAVSGTENAVDKKENARVAVKKKGVTELTEADGVASGVKGNTSEKENKRENDADGENKKKKRRFNIFKKEHKKE